jgi:hypothetical protein
MWYPAEISLSSYLPPELEIGMLFINRISVGVVEPYIELFELEELPEDADAFMAKHGAPVELAIIDGNEEILATHQQIGWWDEGSHTDELRDITLNEINFLLRECEGTVEIEVEEYNDDDGYYYDAEDDEIYFNNNYEEDDEIVPILHEDRVVLRLELEEEFDEWDETLNDELEEE